MTSSCIARSTTNTELSHVTHMSESCRTHEEAANTELRRRCWCRVRASRDQAPIRSAAHAHSAVIIAVSDREHVLCHMFYLIECVLFHPICERMYAMSWRRTCSTLRDRRSSDTSAHFGLYVQRDLFECANSLRSDSNCRTCTLTRSSHFLISCAGIYAYLNVCVYICIYIYIQIYIYKYMYIYIHEYIYIYTYN